MNIHEEILSMGDRAMAATHQLLCLNHRKKNAILLAMADETEKKKPAILEANKKDVQEAVNRGLDQAMIDRLTLTEPRLDNMVKGIRAVSGLKDPIGSRISRWIRPNGLEIVKQRVPIGVIAIIYESRPNVTADSATLCFKTSNAVILRGGKESVFSNIAIVDAMIEGGRKKGLPEHAIQFVRIPDHDAVKELVQLEGRVDLVIPRGGEKLIRTVTENARVPVIKHYKGICHVYVDESASMDMALNIIENAKCQRPGVCNAMETLLVHSNIAARFLPRLAERLSPRKVEFRGDEKTREFIPSAKAAVEEDFYTEYLSLTMSVRVVSSCKEAIEHVNKYGSHHSDAIITENEDMQQEFVQNVDSAVVYVNASTRFTDGGEFGMGAEIGISTDKLHCRGPMGLEELTTYKYIIRGKGQIRE